MAIYPGAVWRPLSPSFVPGKRLVAHNRVNLHTQAGLGSLYGFFNKAGRASSHFWISKGGLVEQYIDTDMRAEADLDGNDATVSVETEGGVGAGANAEAWTPEQVNALISLVTWLMDTHGIPKRLATDSKIGESSRGLSWHRLGIDGNFPALPDQRAGRSQRGGGMRYSSAKGKVCPGDTKIGQIVNVIYPAIAGGVTPVSAPVATAPAPQAPRLAPDGNFWLDEDGSLGPATIGRWQQIMGTPIDWTISPVSTLVKAVQRHLIARGYSCGASGVDGKLGPATIRALQRYLGTPVDGVISRPESSVVKALQRRLNEARF